jgi:hypothetical protein
VNRVYNSLYSAIKGKFLLAISSVLIVLAKQMSYLNMPLNRNESSEFILETIADHTHPDLDCLGLFYLIELLFLLLPCIRFELS